MNNKPLVNYKMLGERLCVDFVNTQDWRDSTKPGELLPSYQQLLDWSTQAGIVTETEYSMMMEYAAHYPAEAQQVHRKALQLREMMHRIFEALINENHPDANDLAMFNEMVANAYQSVRLVPGGTAFSLQFQMEKQQLDSLLPPIVQSALDLLTSEKELTRLKKCEGHPCGWFFVDTSRSNTRRWCSMSDCGNRAKARRFYKNRSRQQYE